MGHSWIPEQYIDMIHRGQIMSYIYVYTHIDVIYPDFPHKHFLTVPDLFYQIAIVLIQVR